MVQLEPQPVKSPGISGRRMPARIAGTGVISGGRVSLLSALLSMSGNQPSLLAGV